MRKGLAALALAALLLAGCSTPPAQGTSSSSTSHSSPAPPAAAHSVPSSASPATASRAPASTRPSSLSIHGVVVDEAIHPLAANVTLVERSETQATAGGAFRFDRLAAGVYTLLVRAHGYEPQNLVVSSESQDEVRVQLAALRGTQPYNVTVHFHGFLECAMEALIITPSCDALLSDPRVGAPPVFRSNYSVLLPVDPYWKTVVADLAFDPGASPLLQGFHVTVRGAHNESSLGTYEQYGRFSGDKPFQVRIEPGQEYPDGTSAVPQNTTVFKFDAYPQGTAYHTVCVPGTATCFLGVGVGQNVEFDLYMTVFYVAPAPDGFRFG
jgi:hypothetical protein